MKTCKKCGVEKEFSEFYKCKKHKDGFLGGCKSCRKSYCKNHKRLNKDRVGKENKVVYLHRKATDNTVFYVGIGNPDRPKSKERSVVWHRTANKHGYIIEVIRRGLSKEEACSIEIDLIELIGRRDLGKGTLVNLTDGGEGVSGFAGANQEYREKRIICLNTGVIYKSIRECSKATGIAHSSISGFLNNIKSGKQEFYKCNFRFLDGNNIVWKPEFDNMIEQDTLPLSDGIDLIDYDYNYDLDSLTENRIMGLAKSFDRINVYPKMILYLNSACDMSLRDIAKNTGIGLTCIHQNVVKSISTLNDNNNPFKYKSRDVNFNRLKKLFNESYVKDDYGIREKICGKSKAKTIKRKAIRIIKEIQETKKEHISIGKDIIKDKMYKVIEVSRILGDTEQSIKQKCENESSVHRNFNGKYTIKGSVIKKWIKEINEYKEKNTVI